VGRVSSSSVTRSLTRYNTDPDAARSRAQFRRGVCKCLLRAVTTGRCCWGGCPRATRAPSVNPPGEFPRSPTPRSTPNVRSGERMPTRSGNTPSGSRGASAPATPTPPTHVHARGVAAPSRANPTPPPATARSHANYSPDQRTPPPNPAPQTPRTSHPTRNTSMPALSPPGRHDPRQ